MLQLSVGSASGGDFCVDLHIPSLCEFFVLCSVICELVFSYLCIPLQADDDDKKFC